VEAPEVVVRDFVARINRHDPAAIVGLCTVEHRFVDSLGSSLSGHAQLAQAWTGYFSHFPDYRIEIESLMVAGDVVLLSGWASATLAEQPSSSRSRSWRIPAAWRARVRGGRLAEWQVYADNKPVYDLSSRDA
jgi:ketosteroid isomerase-like protein